MPVTRHYECDVCRELQDPRNKRWEQQASTVKLEISGAWPQLKRDWSTVCPKCAKAIGDAIVNTETAIAVKVFNLDGEAKA